MKTRKIKISDLLFFTAFSLWIAWSLFENSAFEMHRYIDYALKILPPIILLAKWILISRHDAKRMIISAAIVIITLGVYIYNNTYSSLVTVVLLILSAYDIDYDKIIKVLLKETLIITLFIFICSQIGIIPDYTYRRWDRLAHSYGMKYYSAIGSITMTSIMSYCYLRRGRCRWTEIIILVMLNFLMYRLHTSRMMMLMTSAFLIGYVLIFKLKWIRFKKKIWLYAATIIPTFCLVITLALVWMTARGNVVTGWGSDGIMSRMYYSVEAFKRYGLHMFGTQVQMAGRYMLTYGGSTLDDFYIDSGYIYLLIVYGILFSVAVIILFTVLYRYLYFNNMPLQYLILGIMLFGSIFGDFLMQPMSNPTVFLFSHAIVSGVYRLRNREKKLTVVNKSSTESTASAHFNNNGA